MRYKGRGIGNNEQVKPSLRCEPELTEAIDRMKRAPRQIATAEPIAAEWAMRELSKWPNGAPEGVAAANRVTPEYILATARTRRWRR